MKDYNQSRGISNYMDPFARLFCRVELFERAPPMGEYWIESKGGGELEKLRSEQPGFASSARDQTSGEVSSGTDWYAPGQRMKALVNIASLAAGTTAEWVSQYRGAFSIPMANIYGECNNAHAGRFMES